jgi:hypothetical protein
MDAKITLSFDAAVIDKAKKYAKKEGVSLSRLTEILLRKAAFSQYRTIEDIPVADWVSTLSEGDAEYITTPRKRKDIKDEFYNRRK